MLSMVMIGRIVRYCLKTEKEGIIRFKNSRRGREFYA